MPKQASKVCLSLFMVLSLLVNYSISANPSEQFAPTASESENESISSESLPVLPNPDSPTYVSVPPSANIPDVETTSDETLSQSQENVFTLSNGDEQTEVQTKGDGNLSQELASSPSVNIDPTFGTKSDEILSQENFSTLSNGDEQTDVQTKGDGNLSQELASSPSVSIDPTLETEGDNNISTSLDPSIVDNSVLDTRDMDSLSQENTSIPLSKAADPPAVENEDLFQENTSLPPSPSVDVPVVETKQDENNVSQENLSSETQENTSVSSSSSPPSLAPAYIETPALEISDGGSFTQENQSPVNYVNAPAPETKGEEAATTPPNTVYENPDNVPELDGYSSLPKTVVPAPSEALSFPESDPTIQLTPSNDDTFSLAPTSHQHTILPFNYRAEDEPVEPYEDEEDSWNGVNGAVAGVLVGACVIGVGGFVYKKRKNDNIRAQYQCLAKKGGV